MNNFHLVLVLLAGAALLFAPASAEVVGGDTTTIRVTSSPSGAEVYDAGVYQGTTPCGIVVHTMGTPIAHDIVISKDGYYTYHQYIGEVYTDQHITVSAILTPVAQIGYLDISSSPSGTNVYVDGNYRDTTPEVISVTAGTPHEVRIVHAGYQAYQQTVTVSTGSTVHITANLVTSSDAYLKIASYPSGAAVYVDGTYCGNTGYSSGSSMNYMSVGPLTAGTHTIMLKKDGYDTYTSTVTLSPDEIRTMSVTLTQTQPTPAENAGLYIQSTPSGAEVYVDNVFRGYTPTHLSDIAEGQHTLLLQHSGYNDWTEYVYFTAGQTVEKDVAMSPASVPPAPTQSPFPVLAFAGLAGVLAFAVRRMP